MRIRKGKDVGNNRGFRTEEAYRTLRTNLEFCGKSINVIEVTSSIPNEGKTTICVNLAMSIAETEKRVLLIDADMRQSVLIGLLHSVSSKGLSHYLCGQAEISDVICNTDNANMQVIYAGPIPPNPAELLNSIQFEDLIRSLKSQYDYIIIDSPPLASVIDAAIISRVCDGIIFVCESNKVSYNLAQKVIAQIDKTQCKLLGVVLNKVNVRNEGYGNGYLNKYGNYDNN